MKDILKVEKSIFGGYSLSRLDGKAIFIIGAIPGEKVEIEIIESKKDFSIAKVINVLESSADRISPECPQYNECGGCHYLHMTYQRELLEKKNILIDTLSRTAKLSPTDIPDINIIESNRYNYRSHGSIKRKNNINGFYSENSNKLIELPENGCLLLSKNINDNINTKSKNLTKDFKICEDYQGKTFASSDKKILITEKEKGVLFNRDISSFFQANKFLRSQMLDAVLNLIKNSNENSKIIDLGCGVGFFTLYIAKHYSNIKGFDISKNSIKFAKENAKNNNIKNIEFISKGFSDIHPEKDRADIIICDPPRAGLDKKGRYTINKIEPEKIIYISCNPSTFARDSKDFIKNNYKLSSLSIIDMFPCTKHIEVISEFTKIKI